MLGWTLAGHRVLSVLSEYQARRIRRVALEMDEDPRAVRRRALEDEIPGIACVTAAQRVVPPRERSSAFCFAQQAIQREAKRNRGSHEDDERPSHQDGAASELRTDPG